MANVRLSFKIPQIADRVYNGLEFRDIVAHNWLRQIVFMSHDETDFFYNSELIWNWCEEHNCYVI